MADGRDCLEQDNVGAEALRAARVANHSRAFRSELWRLVRSHCTPEICEDVKLGTVLLFLAVQTEEVAKEVQALASSAMADEEEAEREE